MRKEGHRLLFVRFCNFDRQPLSPPALAQQWIISFVKVSNYWWHSGIQKIIKVKSGFPYLYRTTKLADWISKDRKISHREQRIAHGQKGGLLIGVNEPKLL